MGHAIIKAKGKQELHVSEDVLGFCKDFQSKLAAIPTDEMHAMTVTFFGNKRTFGWTFQGTNKISSSTRG